MMIKLQFNSIGKMDKNRLNTKFNIYIEMPQM